MRHVATARCTLEQYHQMIAAGILDDRRVGLLNGEIIEKPPEGEPHAYYSRPSAKYLEQLFGGSAEVLQGKPITIPTTTGGTVAPLAFPGVEISLERCLN